MDGAFGQFSFVKNRSLHFFPSPTALPTPLWFALSSAALYDFPCSIPKSSSIADAELKLPQNSKCFDVESVFENQAAEVEAEIEAEAVGQQVYVVGSAVG